MAELSLYAMLPGAGCERPKTQVSNKNTIGPATPQPTIPILMACIAENGKTTKPRRLSPPLAIMKMRTSFSNLPPLKDQQPTRRP